MRRRQRLLLVRQALDRIGASTVFMHRQPQTSCQPDVLTTSKLSALDRHIGCKGGSQLRIVRFSLHVSVVTFRRQALPKPVLLRKTSQQFLKFGMREGDRNPPVLQWDSIYAVHNERVLAVLAKPNGIQPALHAPQAMGFHKVLEKSLQALDFVFGCGLPGL